MEIEYLQDKRVYPRVSNADVVVFFKTINGEFDADRDVIAAEDIKQRIFGDKIARLHDILWKKGDRYAAVIKMIDAKVARLMNLIGSFAKPDMGVAELSSVNVSVSGIRFRTAERFVEGAQLELLMIFLPKVDLIDCRCEVVRTLPNADNQDGFYDVATRYLVLHEGDRDLIANYVRVIIENGPL